MRIDQTYFTFKAFELWIMFILPANNKRVFSYFENKYLVDYATEIGASYILRGIRSGQDYEFEKGMRHTNAELKSDITTIFLMPPRDGGFPSQRIQLFPLVSRMIP